MSVNCCMFIGNLTKDPIYREDIKKIDFGMAVNSWSKNSETGQYEEMTTYVDVECWGRMAENAAKYLRKGRKVAIVGELRVRKYIKDDMWHTVYRVNAFQLELLPSGSVGYVADKNNHFQRAAEVVKKKEEQADAIFEEADDDEGLPF